MIMMMKRESDEHDEHWKKVHEEEFDEDEVRDKHWKKVHEEDFDDDEDYNAEAHKDLRTKKRNVNV